MSGRSGQIHSGGIPWKPVEEAAPDISRGFMAEWMGLKEGVAEKVMLVIITLTLARFGGPRRVEHEDEADPFEHFQIASKNRLNIFRLKGHCMCIV